MLTFTAVLSDATRLIAEAAGDATEQAAQVAAVSYPLLVAVVLVGSVLPVLPTGAAVSAAAALAMTSGGELSTLVVIVLAASAAFAGDTITFALFRAGGPRVLRWFRQSKNTAAVEQARSRLADHGVRFLVVARLIPAGRIPALLAAGALKYPWAKFLGSAAAAVAVWATLYALLGVIGGGIFDSPLRGVIATIVLVVVLSVLIRLVQRWWQHRHADSELSAQPST